MPDTSRRFAPPEPQGLYDPAFEHDACGVGFVVDMHGRASHRMVELGISSLCHLDHRGATGAEANVGDGAGILIQVPDRFLRDVLDVELPPAGSYAVGCAFLPRGDAECRAVMAAIEKIAVGEDLRVLAWRDVPTGDGAKRARERSSSRSRPFAVSPIRTTSSPRGALGPIAVRTKVTASSLPSNNGWRCSRLA